MRKKTLTFVVLLVVLSTITFAQGNEKRRPRLVVQRMHSQAIMRVDCSPDGLFIVTTGMIQNPFASSGIPSELFQWNTASRRLIRAFGKEGFATGVAISPDGRSILSGNTDKTITLWDARTGKQLKTFAGHTGSVMEVAWARDMRGFVSASRDQTARYWDLSTGKTLRTFAGHEDEVFTVALSGDGSTLATGSIDGTARLWDVRSGKQLQRFDGYNKGENVSVAFSPNGKQLLTAGEKGPIRLFDVREGVEIRRFEGQPGEIFSARFSRDGRQALTVGNELWLWNVADGKVVSRITQEGEDAVVGMDAQFCSVPGSASGGVLVGGFDGIPKFFDLKSGKEIARFVGNANKVDGLWFSKDERTLLIHLRPNTVESWDLKAGVTRRRVELDAEGSEYSEFSTDGRYLVTLREGTAVVWDIVNVKKLRVLKPTEENTAFASVRFSPDGKLMLTGDGPNNLLSALFGGYNKNVRLWDISTGEVVREFPGHQASVAKLAFSTTGKFIATASQDRMVRLWRVSDGAQILRLDEVDGSDGIAISPRDTSLAVAGDDAIIRLFDIASGREISRFDTHPELAPSSPTAREDERKDVAATFITFSPDGKLLLTAGLDNVVRLWEPVSGNARILTQHQSQVNSAAFTPADARIAATASDDQTVKLFHYDTARELCTMVSFQDRSWIVVDPEGRFDTNNLEGIQGIHWVMPDDPLRPLPVEIFMREYYYPGLLTDILAGKHFSATADLANIDRRQPEVKLALAGGQTAGAVVSERRVKVALEVQEAAADAHHPAGSGAQDVRLFRNGSLVKMWHGDVKVDKDGKAALEAEVTLVAGENRLTAYAFNHDNIKSSDALLTVTGADSLKRPGTAYILAVGINQYASPDFNLRYAAADAGDFAVEIEQQQKKLGRYAKVEITSLTDQQATKANLLAALKHLADVAQPEDAVFIYYAGHGTAAGPRFYLIPHDLGHTGGRDRLDQTAIKAVLEHSVSDLELNQAFEGIDAGEIVLVIDACRSGQALQADDPRQGPMNSKGLAQLAYEKGMYILTASQGYQAALEASSYGHGLLTFALVEEGLRSAKADNDPKDSEVTLREWLDYASQEVPQLELALMQAAEKRGAEVAIVEGEEKVEEVEKRSLQRPRVFYRREPEASPFVVARP